MSEQFADQTLRPVTSWGRCAESFAYDEATGVFSLDNPSWRLRSVEGRAAATADEQIYSPR